MTSSHATCPKCGAEALGKFCNQCGETLRALCKACGVEAPPRSRFCPECGASFKGATPKKTPVASSSRAAFLTPWMVAGGVGVVLAAVGAFLISHVAVQHQKLATKAEATKLKAYWGERLNALAAILK